MRKRIGPDIFLPDEGIVVYLVDETKQTGEGIVRVALRPTTYKALKGGEAFEEPIAGLYSFRIISLGPWDAKLSVASRLVTLRMEQPFQWIHPVVNVGATDQNLKAVGGIDIELSIGDKRYVGRTNENGATQLVLDISIFGSHDVMITWPNSAERNQPRRMFFLGPAVFYVLLPIAVAFLIWESRRRKRPITTERPRSRTYRHYAASCDNASFAMRSSFGSGF